jgi:competence protein ComEC
MALVPLLGGLVGVPADAWMALGVATAASLLVSADLATSVGFLLSVCATAGVLVGVRVVRGRTPGWLWMPLGATMGAQVAVAPLLLAVFGSMPLVAPITNMVAAPVVSLTTAVGLMAVVAPHPALTTVARSGAALVLAIAERGAGGPQLGLFAFLAASALAAAIVVPRTRPLGLSLICVVALVIPIGGQPWPSVPTVVVMDVGQGDAILIQDPSGRAMLVDGGRDPRTLDRAIRRHGVARLDVLALTHGDLDHVGGLVDLLSTVEVGEVWVARYAARSEAFDDVLEDAARAGVPVREVGRGVAFALGRIGIEVIGPSRRYLGDNDGSIVLLASWRRSMLLPADIEAVAQRELPPVRPDAMVVPHHGSSTTDLAWLEGALGSMAVLSYGENTYGHPHPDVLAVLDASGATVHHTMLEGDVTIPLG